MTLAESTLDSVLRDHGGIFPLLAEVLPTVEAMLVGRDETLLPLVGRLGKLLGSSTDEDARRDVEVTGPEVFGIILGLKNSEVLRVVGEPAMRVDVRYAELSVNDSGCVVELVTGYRAPPEVVPLVIV